MMWRDRYLVPVLTGLALCLSAVLILIALYERKATLDHTDRQVCVAVQNINAVLTEQLKRSRANLPLLSYFEAHPEELQRQLRAIDVQLAAFKPRTCR